MIRKKNGFLTFIFSLFPGAGEMYMGFFKQGASIMCVFFGIVTLSSYLMMGPLMYLLPILWFYSFFHVHNLAELSDEEFYALEDKFLFDVDENTVKRQFGKEKSRTILAIVFIIWGCLALWNIFKEYVGDILEVFGTQVIWLYNMLDDLPRIAFAIALIFLGIYLIKGKKRELEQSERGTNK